jgi:hypothetical protein
MKEKNEMNQLTTLGDNNGAWEQQQSFFFSIDIFRQAGTPRRDKLGSQDFATWRKNMAYSIR